MPHNKVVMPRVEEFPDGGRATLVRRYSPPLNRRQLAILASAPYDTPAEAGVSAYRAVRELARMGLVERHPDSKDVFRCTEAGTEVVARWRAAGLL